MAGQEPKQNPPHIPKGLRLRYSLLTLFIVTTAAACCVGCPVAFVRWLDGNSRIATFRGPGRRSVAITTPNFYESFGQPIGIRFDEGREPVAYAGTVIQRGNEPSAEDFAVVWLEQGDVAVAFSRRVQESGYWQAIATYRYSTKKVYHQDDRLPNDLAKAVSAQFAKEHPGVGPIKVPRWEPSIVVGEKSNGNTGD